MKTNLTKLENLNREHCGINFIKTYEVLNVTNLSPIKIKLIELILSFQSNNQHFQMRYEVIGERLGSSERTIKQYISDLKKLGLIITDHQKNYKTDNGKGGSRTYIKVDLDALTNFIETFKREEEMRRMPTQPVVKKVTQSSQPKQEVVLPTSEVEENIQPEPQVNEDYPFRTRDFNPGKMLLRYSGHSESLHILINDFEVHWTKNGRGVIELIDLVGYLFKRMNTETDKNIIQNIKKTLDGISVDNRKYQTAA